MSNYRTLRTTVNQSLGLRGRHYLALLKTTACSITLLFATSAYSRPVAKVQVIEASKAGSLQVSDSLKKITPRLRASFKRFKKFTAISEQTVDLRKGKSHSVKITKGLKVKLKMVKNMGRNIELEVSGHKKGTKHRVKAKLGRLFFEAIKWRGRVFLLAIRPKA